MNNYEFKYKKGSPLLHRGQLYPTVESGIITADKISAVLSCKQI